MLAAFTGNKSDILDHVIVCLVGDPSNGGIVYQLIRTVMIWLVKWMVLQNFFDHAEQVPKELDQYSLKLRVWN